MSESQHTYRIIAEAGRRLGLEPWASGSRDVFFLDDLIEALE